jgi:nitrite reductase/ring-hydroxylating ferredoxin subunit
VTQCGASRERSIGRDAGVVVRTSLNNDAAQVPLLQVELIEDGGFTEVEVMLDGDAESLILHRDGSGVRAWLNVCPHAGRRLDWAPGKFLKSNGLLVCAAHGASFELVEGQCVAGPCRGDRLRAVAIELRDGAVYLAPQ